MNNTLIGTTSPGHNGSENNNNEGLYLFKYICSPPLTVSLYHNPSVWLDTQDAQSWDRNLADFYASQIFYCTAMRKLSVSKGILTHMYHFCFVFIYTLNGYRVLNLLEEICITRVTTWNSFPKVLTSPRGGGSIYICI